MATADSVGYRAAAAARAASAMWLEDERKYEDRTDARNVFLR